MRNFEYAAIQISAKSHIDFYINYKLRITSPLFCVSAKFRFNSSEISRYLVNLGNKAPLPR